MSFQIWAVGNGLLILENLIGDADDRDNRSYSENPNLDSPIHVRFAELDLHHSNKEIKHESNNNYLDPGCSSHDSLDRLLSTRGDNI